MSHMVNDLWLGQKKNLDYLLYNVLMCILQFFLTINYFWSLMLSIYAQYYNNYKCIIFITEVIKLLLINVFFFLGFLI